MVQSLARTAVFVIGTCLLAAGSCEQAPKDPPAPDPQPPQSAMCGGIAGLTCGDPGQYCDFSNANCGAADLTGICTPRPEICPAIFQPVCGCDGKTYGNACSAAAAEISVASEGECAS